MRIIITTNISHIFYRRNALGRDYTWKSNTTIDPADPTTLTYDNFISASESNKSNRGEPLDWDRTPDLYNFRVLTRGQHAAADQVLDWLESGVKEALEKKYLSKLELCFHEGDTDPVSDANPIESYAMTFTYEDEVTHIGSGKGEADVPLTVRDARLDAKNLLDNVEYELATLLKYKEKLPSSRRIITNMDVNHRCPSDYTVKEFISREPNPRLAARDYVVVGTRSMKTKFHRVSIHLPEPPPRSELGSKSAKATNTQGSGAQLEVMAMFGETGAPRNSRNVTQNTKLPESSSTRNPSPKPVHKKSPQDPKILESSLTQPPSPKPTHKRSPTDARQSEPVEILQMAQVASSGMPRLLGRERGHVAALERDPSKRFKELGRVDSGAV